MWMSYYAHLSTLWFLSARDVCAEESVNPFGVLVSFGPVCQLFRVKGSFNTIFLQLCTRTLIIQFNSGPVSEIYQIICESFL